ncbi:vascular cell adhesion protein 1-like isoform X2 [Paralichthys olivaceus]|uniref:vascular cell adhesion protein 1-like isoform X2 n=1 Tax=Paralichthys olivaceus TaxID=8255 RepID=UPI0037525DE0
MFVIPLVVSWTSLLCYFHVSGCEKPVFAPSRLVVKHGDSTSATCSVCPSCTGKKFGLEKAVGKLIQNGTIITWTVDTMTEWSVVAICYYLKADNENCNSELNVIVYKPPDSVSFSFTNHSHMYEANEYTLQCDVRNVAPVENLLVTFYRGQTILAQLQSTSAPQAEPESEVFTVGIKARREDDGAQYWCEARLELGTDGPQPPPVVASQNITATVYYKPHLERSSHPEPIVVTERDRLQLNCSAEGNPSPSFTWRPPVSRPPHHTGTGNTLIINSVTVEDEGLYVCFIRNHMGTVNVTFNVTVKGLLTTTSLPPTTTTTATTTTAATTTATTTTAATTTAAETTQTHIIKMTDAPDSSTSITLTCWFTTWFMIFFSLVI